MTETPEVRLREVEEADLEIFFDHEQDLDAARRMNFAPRPHERFMEHRRKILADPENLHRTVLADGRVAGNISSWTQDGERWVGYVYGREFWGRGVGTAAMRQYLELERGRPLYADPAARNIGSWRLLEKCGFRKEASTMVQNLHGPGKVEHLVYRLD